MAVSLTEGEKKVLSLAWQCFEEMPKVNLKKLAELGGWKTPASANTAYHNARKKVLAGGTLVDGDAKVVKTSPKKRVAAAASEENETLKKRGRKGKSAKEAGTAVESAAEQDEEEEAEMKVKKEKIDDDEGQGEGNDDDADGVNGLLVEANELVGQDEAEET